MSPYGIESAEVAALRAELRKAKRELNETRKRVNVLVGNCEAFVKWLDTEMRRPSTADRGSRVAKMLNELEFSKNLLRLFLGTLPGHERKTTRKQQRKVKT